MCRMSVDANVNIFVHTCSFRGYKCAWDLVDSLLQKAKFWYPKEQGQHYYKNLYVHTSMQTYILTTGKKILNSPVV